MGKIVTLRHGQDASNWKCAFVATVVRLCPDINPDAADEASDAEFCDGVDPLLAAALWVDQQGQPSPANLTLHQDFHPLETDADAASQLKEALCQGR